MTDICLYLDEDATSNRLIQSLRSAGVDVISTLEAEMLSQPDEKQLEWALANQRVIYSFNVRDFYQLHTKWLIQEKRHAGIVLGKQNYSIGDQVRGLLKLISMKSAKDLENQVEFLSRWIER